MNFNNITASGSLFGSLGAGVVAFFIIETVATLIGIRGNVFLEYFAMGSIVLIVIALNFGFILEISSASIRSRSEGIAVGAGSLLLIVLQAHIILEIFLVPAQSWDGLTFWYEDAIRVVTSIISEETPNLLIYRHPSVISALLAVGAEAKQTSMFIIGPMHWFLAYIGLAAFIVWTASNAGWPPIAKICLSVAIFTLPILENHVALYGYTEIFVAFCVVGACSFIANGMRSRAPIGVAVGLLLAVLPIFVRNTGLSYALAVFLPLVVGLVRLMPVYFLLTISAFIIFFLFLFLSKGAEVSLLGNPIGDYDAAEKSARFAGYKIFFRDTTLDEFFAVFFYKLILNQSFGIFIVAAVAVRVVLGSWDRKELLATSYVFQCLVAGLFIVGASLFTDYGYRFAAPASDTGSTRFTIAYVCLSLLFIAAIPYKCFVSSEDPYKNPRTAVES